MSRGARILFVEDEAAIAEPFGRALARAGLRGRRRANGRRGAGALRRQPPDLVLLDLTLPDGDGRDLCRELRSASQVPIIMLTARGTELDRVIGLEIGADDYVVKPFSGAEVVARIRAVLRRAGVRAGGRGPDRAGRPRGRRRPRAGPRSTGRELALSRKEFDLLAELARHAGRSSPARS